MKGKMFLAMLGLLVISFFIYQFRESKRSENRRKREESKEMVSGIITDQYTNEPVSKATIYLLGSEKKANSNSRGAYEIEARMGDELIISHARYKKKSVEITSTDENIKLIPIEVDDNLKEKIEEDFPEMEITQ